MSDINDNLQEFFIFETVQFVEELEEIILSCESNGGFTNDEVNEIFRIMHTIKGSSAVMGFENISSLSHAVEDLFSFLRKAQENIINYKNLIEILLTVIDFMKKELNQIRDNSYKNENPIGLIKKIEEILTGLEGSTKDTVKIYPEQKASAIDDNFSLKNKFKAVIHFEDGCEMENIRAYNIIHNLGELATKLEFIPTDIIEDEGAINVIRNNGFIIYFETEKSLEDMSAFFNKTIFLKDLELIQLEEDFSKELVQSLEDVENKDKLTTLINKNNQSFISVDVNKLDLLMDLVGELVIAEAMVSKNPGLGKSGQLQKALRHLNKITNELQDVVMSVRMVPLRNTFHKMKRIVRDMTKKLDKDIVLNLVGAETEVDKNIIEHLADPLMHLIRNAVDHGIESKEDRLKKGKTQDAQITLEAKNEGSEVLIIVKDNGRGLNKEKILEKAKKNGLLDNIQTDLSDKEIYNFILLPGFSTKEGITEFSGRGVGMDVVTKNIQGLGGTVLVDSIPNEGTTITIRIPLTVAIVDGMIVRVGNAKYIIPITAIQEFFKPQKNEVIMDTDNNEFILVRGSCYSVLRLHRIFNIKPDTEAFHEGILIMLDFNEKTVCIFADELLGQQQIVVKSLPKILDFNSIDKGIAGCTLLGDGNIGLIIDVARLVNYK